MADLPAGTVTLVFTDIEGSTRLLERLGERYEQALADHRELLRAAFASHGGVEVDTQGDAFFFSFPRAKDAVLAAAEGQQALTGHPWPNDDALRVRMGIHTGEPIRTAEGYVGADVHRAARICSAGHGAQVLVSQTTRDLVDDVPLEDLGEHRLKDLARPQRLYQLVVDGLQREFPPLRTLENRPTNLPVQLTPLVGREAELEAVSELLSRDDVRLVTLTGPGGTGKTRLALQAAADQLDLFSDGAYFVALAPINDAALVLPTIAQTLGVSEAAGQSLSGYLGEKNLLLVLDNVEQVLDSARDVGELLATGPGVKILATGREALRLSGERVYQVPPLGLPDLSRLPDAAELGRYEAVALFLDRAQAVKPDFELTAENAAAVAEICARVDGLPLALELAAARATLLSPQSMLARLDERLKLLTGGARDLPERHQTLAGTIDWSYDLLEEADRELFANLSVFVGGFTLEAAEAVADATIDGLASLVDKSLLRLQDERFTMLQVVREYSLGRLASGGSAAEIGRRHAGYYLALAEEAYAERIEREEEWSETLEGEHDNLRAALDFFRETDSVRYLELAGALGWFWHLRSHFAEGAERLSDVLAGRQSASAPIVARALTSVGAVTGPPGHIAEARPALEEAISIWRDLGDVAEEAYALQGLGWACLYGGEIADCRRPFERSLEVERELGEPKRINRAQLAVCQALVAEGDVDAAEPLAAEALELTQEQEDVRGEHLAHHFLADCALIRADCEEAETRYARSLEAAWRMGDRLEASIELQGMGMAAGCGRRRERAVRLAAAGLAFQKSVGADYSGIVFWQTLIDKYIGGAQSELGTEAAASAWEEGRALGLERAVEYALDLSSD